MMSLRVVRAGDMRRVPWKNGRGTTEEIAIGPDGASFEGGDFDWRVSRAAVTEDGPFSEFAGYDRVIVALGGEGLTLSHDGAASVRTVGPLEPYAFRGEWRTTATLRGGPVPDFNVMTRRGAATAEVDVLRGARHGVALRKGSTIVAPLGPARIVADRRTFELAAGDVLVVHDPDAPMHVTIASPDGAPVLVARVVRAAPPAPPAAHHPVRGRDAARLIVAGALLGIAGLLADDLARYRSGHPLAHIPFLDRLRQALAAADFYRDGSVPWVVAAGLIAGLAAPRRWPWVIGGMFLGPTMHRGVRIQLDWQADPTSHNLLPFEFAWLWWKLLPAVPAAWLAAALRRVATRRACADP